MNYGSRITNQGRTKRKTIILNSLFMIHSKGFTLIELLIVVGILGVLAAGVIVAINPIGMINSANIAKGKTFSASVENDLALYQVGKWSFDDQSNPGKDISGYGNDGTLNGGVTWKTPADCGLGLGGCLSFDGVDDWVNVENKTSLNVASGDMTVEAWIKPTVLGERTIVAKWLPWIFFISPSNKLMFYVRYSSSDHNVSSNTPLPSAGKWYHVVAVYTRSNYKVTFYLDGKQDGSPAFDNAMDGDIGVNTTIGYYGNPSNYFKGLIDEVRIYAQALSFAQIQQHYAQGLAKHQLAKFVDIN